MKKKEKKAELTLSDIKTHDKIQITEECYQWKKNQEHRKENPEIALHVHYRLLTIKASLQGDRDCLSGEENKSWPITHHTIHKMNLTWTTSLSINASKTITLPEKIRECLHECFVGIIFLNMKKKGCKGKTGYIEKKGLDN